MDNPQIKKVEVGGHSADIGDSEEQNRREMQLSQERASAVVKYLIKKGVSKDRLVGIGFGDNVPIADNSTKEGRAQNRRVEFLIIDPPPKRLAERRGNRIVIHESINFSGNAADIKEESYDVVRTVAELMKTHPDVKLMEVAGHCADVGSSVEADARELRLSQERADAVVSFLVQEGINAARLVAKGYGAEKPIASNKSKEGRAKNRRVEFHLIG